MGLFDKIKNALGGGVKSVTSAIPGDLDDKLVAGAGNMASKAGDMAQNAGGAVSGMVPEGVKDKVGNVAGQAGNMAQGAAGTVLNAADKVTDKIPGQWDDKAVDMLKNKV
jgi:hypothetical protein